MIVSGHYGFRPLYITRSLVRLEAIIVNFVAIYILIKQSPWRMFLNVLPEFLSCFIMACVAFVLLKIDDSLWLSLLWMAICSVIYFGILFLFPEDRVVMISLKDRGLQLIKNKK